MAIARLPDLDFEAMSAEELLRWARGEFGARMCLTCSWQRQSSVLVHMVSELELDVDVVELDTLVLFPETYETRDRLVERYGLTLRSLPPDRPPDRLRETDPDRCCGIRKVEPLERALRGYDAWITGIRRGQSSTRAQREEGRMERALRRLEDPAARRLGREARRRVRARQRDSRQSAARAGLPVDRLRPVHPARPPGRGRACGPLGRQRQARVRHPRQRPVLKESR